MWALCVVAVAAAVLYVRWRRSGQSFFEFAALRAARLYTLFWHRWSSNGVAPLPAEGPAILYSNHTCSADPMFLTAGSPRALSFVVAREHYNISAPTHWILASLRCVPVTRDGKDAVGVRKILRRLAEGGVVCLFPEGNLSGVAKRRPCTLKHGLALVALLSRAPVYPAYIEGGPRTDSLVRAWLPPTVRRVRVIYGPPVDLSAYYGRRRDRRLLHEVTALLMKRVQLLQPAPARHRHPSLSEGREHR